MDPLDRGESAMNSVKKDGKWTPPKEMSQARVIALMLLTLYFSSYRSIKMRCFDSSRWSDQKELICFRSRVSTSYSSPEYYFDNFISNNYDGLRSVCVKHVIISIPVDYSSPIQRFWPVFVASQNQNLMKLPPSAGAIGVAGSLKKVTTIMVSDSVK